jgi:hypothetical protein
VELETGERHEKPLGGYTFVRLKAEVTERQLEGPACGRPFRSYVR